MINEATSNPLMGNRSGWFRPGILSHAGAAVALPLLALLHCFAQEAVAQETVSITGRIVDVVTGEPIPGVAVEIAPRAFGLQPGFQLETDSEGQFLVPNIEVGEYRLELTHPLYNPEVGDFDVVRDGPFVTTMKPVGDSNSELVTGIVGVLTDAETNRFLSGAAVRSGDGQTGTLTDTRGMFLLENLVPGQHVLEFSMIGYTPRADTVRVSGGRVTNVRVSLSVDPVALDPIDVTVERRETKLQAVGFYDRRYAGFGKFIDRQQIENRGPAEVSDLFTGIPGVEVFPDPFNGIEKYVVLRHGRLHIPTPNSYDRCFPRVYIDGLLTGYGGDEPTRLDQILIPGAIAGIEVYVSTAGLPPQYQGRGAQCGVILVWTRVTASRR